MNFPFAPHVFNGLLGQELAHLTLTPYQLTLVFEGGDWLNVFGELHGSVIFVAGVPLNVSAAAQWVGAKVVGVEFSGAALSLDWSRGDALSVADDGAPYELIQIKIGGLEAAF